MLPLQQPLPSLEIKAPARRIPPIFIALFAQLGAILLLGGCAYVLNSLGYALNTLSGIGLASLFAVMLSRLLGMANWWLIIQAIFLPAIVGMLTLTIEPIWFLAGFILLALIFGHTYKTQVPLYLSRKRVWEAVVHLLPQERSLHFVDLGSGLGGLLHHLARQRPDCHFTGIETAVLPSLISKFRVSGCSNADIDTNDFWNADFRKYDVVFAYLSPVPMTRLWEKVQHELRPGSIFISYRFPVPGAMPDQIIELNDIGHTQLYLWRL